MPTSLASSRAQRLHDARAADRRHRIRTCERRIATCDLGSGLLVLGITLCLATCTLQVFHSASNGSTGGVFGGIAVGAASLLVDALRRRVERAQRGWNEELNQELNQELSVAAGGSALNLPPAPPPTPPVPTANPTQLAELRGEIWFLAFLRLGAAVIIGALWSGVWIGLAVGLTPRLSCFDGPVFLLAAVICGLVSIPCWRLRSSLYAEHSELEEHLSVLSARHQEVAKRPQP